MIELIFLFSLGIIWLVFATIQDLKEKEIDNWISLSLIIFALGFRFFYCLFTDTGLGEGFGFFYQGLIGLGIFFILGHLFYYSKLFAGGDAKMMIALGSVLPLSNNFFINVYYFVVFLMIFLFAGGVYGIITSLILVFRNYKSFKKELSKRSNKSINFITFVGLLLAILGFFSWLFLLVIGLILVIPFMYICAKSIDESSGVKKVSVKKLREGDWLYENVKIGKKLIKAKWDGLNKKEIKLIQKKKKFIKIRQGIAFIPVFLIAFVLFMVFFLVAKGLFPWIF